MKIICEELPKVLGNFPIKVTENMLWLYLPIKMANEKVARIPEQLEQFRPLLEASVYDNTTHEEWLRSYVYITAKNSLIHPHAWQNRGGAHCDGFLTNDRNWAWYDKNPTLFNSGRFEVTADHNTSLREFEAQWDYKNNVTYPEFSLLELTPKTVHQVAPVTRYDTRTFVKFSLSTEKYNLIGNSRNYLFDYDWKMYDRNEVRNSPIYAELSNSDYVPADIA